MNTQCTLFISTMQGSRPRVASAIVRPAMGHDESEGHPEFAAQPKRQAPEALLEERADVKVRGLTVHACEALVCKCSGLPASFNRSKRSRMSELRGACRLSRKITPQPPPPFAAPKSTPLWRAAGHAGPVQARGAGSIQPGHCAAPGAAVAAGRGALTLGI